MTPKTVFKNIIWLSVVFFFCSCSKNEPTQKNHSAVKKNTNSLKPPLPAGSCDCGTQPVSCPGLGCINSLLNNQNSKLFTVRWKSCVNPDPSYTYCNGFGVAGEISYLTICYKPGSCDRVTCIITNPPSCLPCLPDPYCIPLSVSCPANDDLNLWGVDNSPGGGNIIRVTITSDPKVVITCGGNGNDYNCVGELQ